MNILEQTSEAIARDVLEFSAGVFYCTEGETRRNAIIARCAAQIEAKLKEMLMKLHTEP